MVRTNSLGATHLNLVCHHVRLISEQVAVAARFPPCILDWHIVEVSALFVCLLATLRCTFQMASLCGGESAPPL